MITKEQLENASAKSKMAGPSRVLTSEQAFERANSPAKTLVCISNTEGFFFFTDDHTFGYDVLSKDWNASTTFFPLKVGNLEGTEFFIVDTIDKYISVFQNDYIQFTLIEQLIDFLNIPYSFTEESDEQYFERIDRILESQMPAYDTDKILQVPPIIQFNK